MLTVNEHQEKGYIFELKSESGHTLLKSIPFPNRKTAIDSAKGLNRLVEKSTNFERKTNHDGQFLFNFKNAEGSLIGRSQLYNSEAGMENGIKNLTVRVHVLIANKHL